MRQHGGIPRAPARDLPFAMLVAAVICPAPATASPASAGRQGRWSVSAQCEFAPPEECIKVMSQRSSGIDVRIYRSAQRFELQATIRSCDREHEFVSYEVPAGEWEPRPRDVRQHTVRAFIDKWAETAQSGCSQPPSRPLSLKGFRRIFRSFDARGF